MVKAQNESEWREQENRDRREVPNVGTTVLRRRTRSARRDRLLRYSLLVDEHHERSRPVSTRVCSAKR